MTAKAGACPPESAQHPTLRPILPRGAVLSVNCCPELRELVASLTPECTFNFSADYDP